MKTLAGCLCAALLLGTGSAVRADVDNLIKNLKAKDPDVRRNAARELGLQGAGARGAVAALARALKDEDPFVRRFAALALGEVGPEAKEAVPALSTALKDSNKRVADAAATALGKTGVSGVQPLLDIAKDDKRETAVRVRAIESLGKIGPDAKDAVPALMEVLAGKMVTKGKGKNKKMQRMMADGALRVEAAQALGQMGPAAKEAEKTLEEIVANKRERNRNLKQTARAALRKIKK